MRGVFVECLVSLVFTHRQSNTYRVGAWIFNCRGACEVDEMVAAQLWCLRLPQEPGTNDTPPSTAISDTDTSHQ